MNFEELEIKGLFLITPDVFGDERGFFMETYNKKVFMDNGIEIDFIQDNHSRSGKNVLRGLHWQKPPFAQDKLVWVVRGAVLDIAVDMRKSSPTFGKHVTVELNEENKHRFLVPKGFAHGFITLSDIVDFQYKVSNLYSRECERGIIWNDPDLAINYDLDSYVMSEKDLLLPKLKDIPLDDLFD